MSHPAARVAEAAEDARLGDWEASTVPDPAADSPTIWFMWAAGVPMVAAYAVVPLVWFGTSRVDGGEPGLGWTLIVIGVVVALLSVIAAAILFVTGYRHLRRGSLVVHRYAEGLVLERVHGRIAAARYETMPAELLVFENASEDGTRHWDERFVILTLPDASTASIFVPRDPTAATELASRCGTPDPRRVTLLEAVDLREENEWA